MRWEDDFNLIHNYIERVYDDYTRKTVVKSVLWKGKFYVLGFVQFHNSFNIKFFQINRHTMKIFEIENLSVTKEQGNAIYKSIMKSEKINKMVTNIIHINKERV